MSDIPRIAQVQLFPVRTARLYGEPSSHIVVRLTAEDGAVGWGEMSDLSHLPAIMPDVRDLEATLRILLEGRSAGALNEIEDLMLANFPGGRFHGKACLVRAGVSIAIHDLKARLFGLSVSDLLGGARRQKIPICYPVFRMKSRADVPDRLAMVERQFEKGFRAFRLYFSKDTDADVEFLSSVYGRFGDRITFTSLDGSGLFTLPAFLRAYRRLSDFPFQSVESPVDRDDVDLIAEARHSIDHPVSEHVRSPEYAIRLIRAKAVDIFNISITVAGGIQGMNKLFALADSANLECLIGTTQELSIATAAQSHVGATCLRLDYPSDPVGPSLYEFDVTRTSVEFSDGCLLVPSGLGLGVEGDLDKINSITAPLSAVNDVNTGFTRG
jgi:L-alanine-DL-glutamate epimerase-like enolase superfamily enzyme